MASSQQADTCATRQGTRSHVFVSGKKGVGYHRRSLVEAKTVCIKKLGERVQTKTFKQQVVELHVPVSILNRLTELGHPEVVAVESLRLGFGLARSALYVCNKAHLTQRK